MARKKPGYGTMRLKRATKATGGRFAYVSTDDLLDRLVGFERPDPVTMSMNPAVNPRRVEQPFAGSSRPVLVKAGERLYVRNDA